MKRLVLIAGFVLVLILTTAGIAKSYENFRGAPKVPEVKVALLGDTEAGNGFAEVLNLVKAEGSDVVMINGDFGYNSKPEAWKDRLLKTVDPNDLTIIGSLGNHDRERKGMPKYIQIFDEFRTAASGLRTACSGQKKVQQGQDVILLDEVCNFGNVTIVASGIGQYWSKGYFEERLDQKLTAAPSQNWKLVGYHYTVPELNPGLKSKEEASYKFFDIIRRHGAIGTQAHTHSVMASCPISSSILKGAKLGCDSRFGANLQIRNIFPGVGLFMDSSLGGKEARPRKRCLNPGSPDCYHMVDLITSDGYSRSDGKWLTNFDPLGALFVVFNHQGDPRSALVYYKSIDGQEVFRFNVVR